MMKRIFYSCALMLALFSSLSTQAQQEEEPEPLTPASGNASQIYGEFLGPGGIYSINYDGRFGKRDKGLGGRAGFSVIAADGSSVVTFPLGLNYLAGQRGNYFEFGAGITIATGSEDIFADDATGSFGHITFGYRRQAYRKKGVTWRIAFTPIFGDGYFVPWLGGSIGYRF